MDIPFVDLAARHQQAAEQVEAAVLAVLRSGRWIGGPVVAEAEALAARWMGRRGAVGVASGTDALMLALQAVGVRPGDEVVVPALSFFATAGAVVAIGARPVIADVGEDGLVDPTSAAAAMGPRVKAVIPVHLFGSVAPPLSLGVPVVDDAAQAIGASPVPGGLLVALSTYPTKTWGSAGDGGFVLGDDPELLDRVRRLGHHGVDEHGRHDLVEGHVGRASRLDAVQAAVLCAHAQVLEARLARRRELAARYDRGLPRSVVPLPRSAGSAVHQYVVRVAERDHVRERLAARGIGTGVYYPRPLHHHPALADARAVPTPVAEALAAEVLALPIHDLGADQVDQVIATLSEVA